jgi:hypothetical protein
MATILLAACVVACPLVMGAMMLSMRSGKPLRKRRQTQRSRGASEGERT